MILFHYDQIQNRVREIAKEIEDKYMYNPEPLVIIGIMDGSFRFLSDLCKNINIPLEIRTIKIKTYSGLDPTIKPELSINDKASLYGIKGCNIVIIDDILDSGKTLSFFTQYLKNSGINEAEIAVLLNRNNTIDGRMDIFPVNYTGFDIGPGFVSGYGLDYNGYDRNLNCIKVN